MDSEKVKEIGVGFTATSTSKPLTDKDEELPMISVERSSSSPISVISQSQFFPPSSSSTSEFGIGRSGSDGDGDGDGTATGFPQKNKGEGEQETPNSRKDLMNADEEKGAEGNAALWKRRMTMPASTSEFRRTLGEEAKMGNASAEEMERRLKDLVSAFSARTKRTKAKIKAPPTPSSSESELDEPVAGAEEILLQQLRAIASPSSQFGGDGGSSRRKSVSEKVRGSCARQLKLLMNFVKCEYVLDADGGVYVCWLVVVAFCFLYNAFVIPLRAVFPYQTKENIGMWLCLDYLADAVYLFDIIAFKSHRKFLAEGFWIKEPSETRKSYFQTLQFKVDLIALFPADILVSAVYWNFPLLRIPRLLKIDTYWELFQRFDTILASPHSARITKTLIYMIYMIHANACAYYALSKMEGIGTTTWTFDGEGNAYIVCFYFATKTATSIGKNKQPENQLEYLYMTFAWLSGVFITAILIGQIRDIIATATKNQNDYRVMTYNAVSYLHRLGVPKKIQSKVQLWLSYTWEQQKTLDESKILELLPDKMRTDVALDLHVETLAKVKLFQGCEVPFLRDLVVKIDSIIFLPGDYICKKGEVGREMFIVKSGKIHVIGGPSGTQILVTLGSGSVFGEIALLGIGGMNKRTADVRAAGFANLFVLRKDGLEEAIRDYPASQEIIRKKAKKLLKENIKKAKEAAEKDALLKELQARASDAEDSVFGDDVIIKNKPPQPKLINAMIQIFPLDSKMGRYLTLGTKAETGIQDRRPESIDLFDDEGNLSELELTSYPPTPFVPGSPNHISLELDISIMTGDSSDRQLSPPPFKSPSTEGRSSGSSSKHARRDKARGKSYNSGSTRSAEELKGYLEDNDFDDKSLSGIVRCSTPIPPLSPNSDNCGPSSQNPMDPTDVPPPTAITPVPRHSPIHLDDCDEEEVQQSSSSFKVIEAGSGTKTFSRSREILPVKMRPPVYPILPGNCSGISLSSSEESLEADGTTTKTRSGKEMSQRAAAIIASRFLTAIKGRAPLKRQLGLEKQHSLDSAEVPKCRVASKSPTPSLDD